MDYFNFSKAFGRDVTQSMSHGGRFSISFITIGNCYDSFNPGIPIVDEVGIPIFLQEFIIPFMYNGNMYIFRNWNFYIFFQLYRKYF